LHQLLAIAAAPVRWLETRLGICRPARRMRLLETLSLGANRFLVVVQVEQRRLLVGSSGNSIVLLARLDSADSPAAEQDAGEIREASKKDFA